MSTTPDTSLTIAIVSSNAFDFGRTDIDGEVPTPAGKDIATFILQRLVAAGATCLAEPVPGEEGWTFDIELDWGKYRVFVHWAPIGDPPEDRWVVQPDICKPLLRSLFGRRTALDEIQPAVSHYATYLKTQLRLKKSFGYRKSGLLQCTDWSFAKSG